MEISQVLPDGPRMTHRVQRQSDLFAKEALAQIPKILTLQDRSVHSPTYGCFDRNFWHYKIIDFPCGMSQEFVWPLALAYSSDVTENPYFQKEAFREWIAAGILYAARSAHADGSCDDYFPFEKAGGAAAFSLLACVESYLLLGFQNDEMLAFFHKRADWLANHHESGQLTNHQALIVLCLERVGKLLGTTKWEEAKQQRLARVIEWQNEEGWFQEYEGCDPGYHTLTISLLAQVYELIPVPNIKQALEKAVRFVTNFVHPDGSFGGEYASRNTYNFFPHGFELAGRWMPEALEVNDRFLNGLSGGLAPCYADDHTIGHHTWSYFLAWKSYVPDRPPTSERPQGRLHFKNAGFLIERRGAMELYLGLNKGGVFKLFRDGKLVVSDTQISLQIQDQKLRTAVAHLISRYDFALDEQSITVRGKLGWAKQKQMTTFNLLVLRAIMLLGGRFYPDLVRKLLQKVLITGSKPSPFDFFRKLTWTDNSLQVVDEISGDSWKQVVAAGIGGSQTSIYVVMSRTFQAGQMQPWLDLTPEIGKLHDGQSLRVERTFP